MHKAILMNPFNNLSSEEKIRKFRKAIKEIALDAPSCCFYPVDDATLSLCSENDDINEERKD